MKPNVFALLVGALGMAAISATAEIQPISLSSGIQNNDGFVPRLAFAADVSATNQLRRIRVHFSEYQFGAGSYARLQSMPDGQEQRLDAAAMKGWSGTSGMFNGSVVRVELYVAPGDQGVFFVADSIIGDCATCGVSDPAWHGPPPGAETLCGGDDRVGSSDNRVGRINGGCTGWLVANGGVLTAGHCGIAAGSIFEVNIPPSAANGATIAAAIQDQFPVLAGSITTVNNGVGNDWTVCRLGTNNLGEYAHERHGFFRMTRELPGVGQTIRITGCGIDNAPQGSQPTVCGNTDTGGNCTHFGLNAQSQTLQTSAGGFMGESGSEPRLSLQYATDTEPANSGSPIIWEANGYAIGIHTAGGCNGGGGANNGTSFELNALENAIAAVPGPNARYLDTSKAPSGAEDGTVFQPHDTLAEAVLAVPSGGIISIVRGGYTGTANRGTINKPMTLVAPVGPATIGQ